MRCLVTGAAGFVGRYLTAQLSGDGHEVIGVDSGHFSVTDAPKTRQFITDCQPEIIYHLAALSHVPTCQTNLHKTLDVNVAGTANITKAAICCPQPPRIIFISTANLYGFVRQADNPIGESQKVAPANNYALSKYLAEGMVAQYEQLSGRDCVIFRPFNHTGAGQSVEFALPAFAEQIKAIKVTGSPGSIRVGNLSARRDFSAVQDIVRAYSLAAGRGRGIYNLGSGESYQLSEALELLLELAECDCRVEFDPERFRPSDLPELTADISKVRAELDWQPTVSFREILQSLLG